MVVIIIIGVLVLIIAGLLFTPVIVQVNTVVNKYEIRLRGFMKAWMSVDDNEFIFHVSFPGYHFKKRPKFRLIKKRKKKEKSTFSRLGVGRIINVMRSFKVKTFEAALDTDDYVLNAQLVPLSLLLRYFSLNASVNFQGSSYCKLEIRNNLWRLGLSFLELKKY